METAKKGKTKKSRRKDFDDDDIEKELEEIAMQINGDIKSEHQKQVNTKSVKDGDEKKEKPSSSNSTIKQSEIKTDNQPDMKTKTKENQTSKKKDKPKTKEEKKDKSKTKEEMKKVQEEEAKGKKKPNKKVLEAMKELLAKQKEEEERRKKEEERLEKEEQERIRKIKEQRRLEEERKEKQKQKHKERLKKLKEEGKLLTPKQKLEQQRTQAMLEHLKAQGVIIPEAGEKLQHAPTHKRQKKKKQEKAEIDAIKDLSEEVVEDETKTEIEEIVELTEVNSDDGVIDDWDQLSDSENEEETLDEIEKTISDKLKNVEEANGEISVVDENKNMESESNVKVDYHTEAEKRRERAIQRIEQRKIDNENKVDGRMRAPVVCVLGHVDHGKTKILDKLRRTNVQEGEVGGITQQIGATNVPLESIRSQTRMVKDFKFDEMQLPGLLIIDTPGHESFSNLRSRGSSLCDIAILVVDITQGLEPQTIESISLLKKRKTPFVVALNKVDRVFEWESQPSKDICDIIKSQSVPSKNNFEKRSNEIIQALNMQGLNAALFWENPDPRSYVSLVPTSAITGDGMGNLMALLVSECQKRLSSRLIFSHELQCTVLEVKTIQGHGTTIDVILINGILHEGDSLVLAGTEGPIVTQIRSLLIPKPMKEIRVKGQYDELKCIEGALGVKIAARDLDKAIAGLNLRVAYHEDEIEILREEVDREFKSAMRSIKVKDKGVYVQASTLGALEALLEFFKTNKIPFSGIRVGAVSKKDVMKASAMLEHDPMYAVILAFDVKAEREAQDLADKEGVKIFMEETIYHLGDRYVEYLKDYKMKRQDEFRHIAVFPCRLKIIPDNIFNKRDPIVIGVTVEAGILRTGTPLCVPKKNFVDVGVVTSLEFDHKMVEIAKKGINVCVKIEPLPGHTPELFGRHFDETDILVSKISRESIDACKDYFRDDLGKNEWKLMAELKKEFVIL